MLSRVGKTNLPVNFELVRIRRHCNMLRSGRPTIRIQVYSSASQHFEHRTLLLRRRHSQQRQTSYSMSSTLDIPPAVSAPVFPSSGRKLTKRPLITRPRVASTSNQPLMHSTSEPFREGRDKTPAVGRSRSQSPSSIQSRVKLRVMTAEAGDNANFVPLLARSSVSISSSDKHLSPYTRSDKAGRRRSISSERSEDYSRTRERVSQAIGTVLGTASGVARDVLTAGVDLLQFAPIPALGIAGSILVSIWQAIETIEANDTSCLRLAERCAETLMAVHHLAQPDVALELEEPVQKLQEAFTQIQTVLERQSQRPFFHRYLKREEMRRSIGHCETSLGDALGLFMIKIQLHTLRAVNGARNRRLSQANSTYMSDVDSVYSFNPGMPRSAAWNNAQTSLGPDATLADGGHSAPLDMSAMHLAGAMAFPEALTASEDADAFERELMESGARALKRLSDIMSDLSVSSWTVTECGTERDYSDEDIFISPSPGRASHIAPWDSPRAVGPSLHPTSSPKSEHFHEPETLLEDCEVPLLNICDVPVSPPYDLSADVESLNLAETVMQAEVQVEDGVPPPIWPPLDLALQEQDIDVLGFRSRCMAYGSAVHPDTLDVALEVNPILAFGHRSDDTDDKYLIWNLLTPSSEAHMSTHPTRRWFEERIEPATFPPVTHLYVLSSSFPWAIFVSASTLEFGVSCGDVIGALSGVLQSALPPSMWGEKGQPQRRALKRAYRANRSNEVGSLGHKLGEGMRFADMLGSAVMFNGLYSLYEKENGPPVPGVLAVYCN
ncbi:unnamed protein product [Peniophora sp. CBMAI 1063]|nr:unnamed protein product [Peniophora sp. CBMAI 1063]